MLNKITLYVFRHSLAPLLIHLGYYEYEIAAVLIDSVQTVMTIYYIYFKDKKKPYKYRDKIIFGCPTRIRT